METVYTKNAPEPVGPYSQAVKSGDLLFCSGQIPINPATNAVEKSDITGQSEQVIANIQAVLAEAGLVFENVVKTTCFLQYIDDFAAFNEIYARYFTSKPARSCVEAARLPKNVLVEIEVVAEYPK